MKGVGSRIMNIVRKIIKSVLFWIISAEIILVIILFAFGFRITYAPELEPNWESVGAIGQWAVAIVGVLIPIAAVYVQYELNKNKREIGEANSELYNELSKYAEKLKILTKLVNERGDIVVDGGDFNKSDDENQTKENLKNKALKFINISMITNTKRVAEHLGISDVEAFDILKEMVLDDKSISCGGQLDEKRLDYIVWTKRS